MIQKRPKSNSQNFGTVLLADDDAAVRRFLEVVLRRAGYTVIPAKDGAEALQKALEKSPDVAILDAMMPNLNGYELCRIFRQHPDFKNILILILSGLENEIFLDADACLTKTADMQDRLLEILEKMLETKQH